MKGLLGEVGWEVTGGVRGGPVGAGQELGGGVCERGQGWREAVFGGAW